MLLTFLRNQRVVQDQVGLPRVDEVINAFWGRPSSQRRLFNGQQNQGLDMSAYAEYFRRQWHAMTADADGSHMTQDKINDILQIGRYLLLGEHRDAIVSQLNQTNPTVTKSVYESSIDLAARLLLMLKVGVVRHQANPCHYLKWENGSLEDFVRERFNKPSVLDYRHVRLPKSFDAWSISVIGGLRLEFTDNLADHLLLIDDDTTVLVFHHASFLECQVKLVMPLQPAFANRSKQSSTLYPEGLVDETLRTLALLFPQSEFNSSIRGNSNKRKWLRKLRLESSPCLIDPQVALCGNLRAEERQIERFTFWRDRLIILKQIYDDAAPRTLQQWWHDRRNGERWFTFWVAVLVLMITITLGLIQCIESALQVYKAYYPTI